MLWLKKLPKKQFSTDRFSGHSDLYAKYRPTYPQELFSYLSSLTKSHDLAWDVGTGNGQATFSLASHYTKVIGTDISPQQIDIAKSKNSSISFEVLPAELSAEILDSHKLLTYENVDLITIATALHYFDLDRFYDTVNKVLKQDGVIAAWTYGVPNVDENVDRIANKIYWEVCHKYYNKSRKYVDEKLKTIKFPFDENLPEPPEAAKSIKKIWSIEEYWGNIHTWSAVKNTIKALQSDPTEPYFAELCNNWPRNEKKPVVFPLYFRIGRKKLQS